MQILKFRTFKLIVKNGKNENMLLTNKYMGQNTSFSGKTRIFALTDSHLQTRDKCALLSKILDDAKKHDNVLALDCGDLFKGVYPPQTEVDSYITAKKLRPNLEIVINIGNNDPGYNQEGFEFFKKSVKTLTDKGIHVISANMWDKNSGERLEGIKPYAVIKRDKDRIFVAGFCINNLTQTTYGVKSEDPQKVLEGLKQAISDEKPDGLIILNHDWFTQSKTLMKFAKEKGIKVDLLIGGHEHEKFEPDTKQRIYYPEAFNRSMYQFDLLLCNGSSRLKNIKLHQNKGLSINPIFDKQLSIVEKREKLMNEIASSTLNLTKSYSNPGALGTFLADAMKDAGNTDIAFLSTGFLMAPLPYEKGKKILEYDLKKTIIAQTPIEKITLTSDTLKEVFENALKNRMLKDIGNAKFLQCSQNIKLVGEGNIKDKSYSLKQIFINNEPLLDEKTGKALDSSRQITCAIDSFIGSGGQEFTMLKDLPKEKVLRDEKLVPINELLKKALKKASSKITGSREYPTFEIVDL